MEFLGEIFTLYWKEVIVAVMLTATLPFIRKYVRRRRAMVINFFKEKERLKEALRKAEELAESERIAREEVERKLEAETVSRQKAHDEAERLRAELDQECKARETTESNLQAEADKTRKAQEDADNLRAELGRERKVREEAERQTKADSEEMRKIQSEADNLRSELMKERTAREQAEEQLRKYDEQKKAQEAEANSIEAEFNREYARIQNEIKEKGSFEKFADGIFYDSKALPYDEAAYEACRGWTSGLFMPTRILGDIFKNGNEGVNELGFSVRYLLAYQHSKDEISQFTGNALISFYNFAKEALLAVGVHLVNCGKMTLDELRNGYCWNILDLRDIIRNKTQCSVLMSLDRQAYHRTTEILRKAIEAQIRKQ